MINWVKIARYISIFLVACVLQVYSDVLIITHSYNRPDFIEWQHHTFEKFIQDKYRFVVFNDACDPKIYIKIREICEQLNLECIDIPQEIHSRPYLKRSPGDAMNGPHARHCNCLQYSLDTLGFKHNGPLVIVDADIFLIRPLSVANLLKNSDVVAPIRWSSNGIRFPWPGLLFMAMDKLPEKETMNFNYGMIDGGWVDSGGFVFKYFLSHPEITLKGANEIWSYQLGCPDYNMADKATIRVDLMTKDQKKVVYQEFGFNDQEIDFLFKGPDTINFALDNHFLHYRGGSGYDHRPEILEQIKSNLIHDFIIDILSE